MFDFIQNFIYFVLEFQNKLLNKKNNISFKTSFSNSTSKTAYCDGASLELKCKTNTQKDKVKNNIEQIVKKYNNDPEELIKFIEKSGTKVYRTPFYAKIAKFIGCEDGFINELIGFKAFCLSFALAIFCKGTKPMFKTKPMFLISNSTPEQHKFLQQFYKWYSMKFNLPGFDEKSQENFQKFLYDDDAQIKNLSIEEIIGLKEAIARDVEAINFVVELTKTTVSSKSAMKKITTGGASV